MPAILDYRNTIQNFIHGAGRSIWAKDLVAAAVINNGILTEDQIVQICEDIEQKAGVPSFTIAGAIGSAIPKIELKILKHVANVNRLVPDQTIHFCHEGITVLFGHNGSGKSGYFRILNKLAGGLIDYSVMQDIYDENPQPMSVEATYAENGVDHVVQWDFDAPLSTPLNHMRVFDSNYAKAFTKEHDSNTYLFDCMGLSIYRGIADGLARLKELGYDVSSDEEDIKNLCTANYSDKLVRALEIRFKEELKVFDMDYLMVSLQLSDITDPLSKIKLSLKNNHELDVVLSEAELKCCALALFIAECELLDVKQPVIFDDPVNSLDASVIGLFANRLVEMEYPVILFTHNTQLLSEIKYADNVKVYKDHTVARQSDKRRVLIYEVLRNTPDEVGYITEYSECKSKFYLGLAKDILDNHSNPLTQAYQKTFADNLRMAIEWIVDEVFFRGLIPNRFRGRRDFIQWAQLETMVGQNGADVRTVHTIYERVSSVGIHVGAAHVGAPLRKDQCASFYNQLKTIVDNAGI